MADPAASDGSGTLSLFRIAGTPPAADLDAPLLADEPAYAGFALDEGRLAWARPAGDGAATIEVLAWDGETVGRLTLPGNGGTVVR